MCIIVLCFRTEPLGLHPGGTSDIDVSMKRGNVNHSEQCIGDACATDDRSDEPKLFVASDCALLIKDNTLNLSDDVIEHVL